MSLCIIYRYASRVKLITNDASKNAENKEINRLKNVSFVPGFVKVMRIEMSKLCTSLGVW